MKKQSPLPVHATAAILFATLALLPTPGSARGDDGKVGVRPYEMVDAGRDVEVGAAIVDFENLEGWTVETRNAIATFEKSREEQMYGEYVGKLTYRQGGETGDSVVDIRPPQAPAIPKDSDVCSCWIVGNNWGWTVDPSTPRVRVSALVKNAAGDEFAIPLETVDWKEWFLCYRIIPSSVRAKFGDAPVFSGFRVSGGSNTEDRTLYFDSLRFFKEDRAPLEIGLRPKPGIDLFEGQSLGVNAGEGRLPFPTNPDTILPDSSANLRTPMFHFYGDSCDFVYTGSDGELVYYYKPEKGDWSDFTVAWNAAERFHPLSGGGVTKLIGANGAVEPVDKAEKLEFKTTETGAVAKWRLTSATATADVEYRMQIKGKSLVVDTIALGGKVPELGFGRVENIGEAKTFSIPYYLYDYGRRPGVALIKTALPENPTERDLKDQEQLYLSAHVDWYRSGASYLRGTHGVETLEPGKQVATLNGAAEYRPKTDGTRNDLYERFIFTVSPRFEETLPTIANPASPYKAIAGSGVWRSHGATTRDGDKKYWRDVWRRGMRKMIITDHEVCWRDGGESFTFRTKPAPKKGGDEGWFDYARFMQDELGFVYGPYNNFTDFAPVNGFWSPDMVNRGADWSLQRAWMRCYAPKPTRAVEFCEKLTPIIENKFHFSCAYCDVHSSVPPWTRTDYDERVPGAGTFMSVYYPYGEIFLLQKKNWDGPTYSEGPHHCFYAGLTDGNYAQDQPYNLFNNPWLLDFDLRKMHDLEVDFGMGNVGMFAPGYNPQTPEEKNALIDRFITATLAFGHSGFFADGYFPRSGERSYFMTQAIAARYTQTSAKSIEYYGETTNGEKAWMDVSAALAADAVKNNCVKVVYDDGTTVYANGSTPERPYELPLPKEIGDRVLNASLGPNEYVAWSGDGAVFVESTRSRMERRYDYAESPDYVYFDGRGNWTERGKACGAGVGLCRAVADGEYEFIFYDGAELGFKVADAKDDVSAVALDYDGNELGDATVKRSRGFVFIVPVEKAFSYRVKVDKNADASAQADAAPGRLYDAKCGDVQFAPGGLLAIHSNVEYQCGAETFTAPNALKEFETIEFQKYPTTTGEFVWRAPKDPFVRFWQKIDSETGAEQDFNVVPAAAYEFKLISNDVLEGVVRPFGFVNRDADRPELGGFERTETFEKFLAQGAAQIPLPKAREEGVLTFPFEIAFPTQYSFGAKKPSLDNNALNTGKEETYKYEIEFTTMEERPSFGIDFMSSDFRRAFYQRRGAAPSMNFDGTGASPSRMTATCGNVSRDAFQIHPPYLNGPTGRTYLEYDLAVPETPAVFEVYCGKRNGSDLGNGILFQVSVQEPGAEEVVLAETTVETHEWKLLEADLASYAGKSVKLRVVADARQESSGDWACVADMTLREKEARLKRQITAVRQLGTGSN